MTVQDVGGIVSLSGTLARYMEGCYNFDIGPRSVVIDTVVRYLTHKESEYDNDRVLGSREVGWKVFKHPYFTQNILKTIKRKTFGYGMLEDICERMTVIFSRLILTS